MAVNNSFMVMPYSSLPGMGPVAAVDRGPPQAVRKTSKKMMNKNNPIRRGDNLYPASKKLCRCIVFLLIKNLHNLCMLYTRNLDTVAHGQGLSACEYYMRRR